MGVYKPGAFKVAFQLLSRRFIEYSCRFPAVKDTDKPFIIMFCEYFTLAHISPRVQSNQTRETGGNPADEKLPDKEQMRRSLAMINYYTQ